MMTVADVVAKYGVTEQTVLVWIHQGSLRALNVGRAAGAKKPRWRIRPEDLAAWELSRESGSPPPKPTRRRKQPAEVIPFYA
jgi:predicted site-specific integrase-resolvase